MVCVGISSESGLIGYPVTPNAFVGDRWGNRGDDGDVREGLRLITGHYAYPMGFQPDPVVRGVEADTRAHAGGL